MFTGLVDHVGTLLNLRPEGSGLRLWIQSRFGDFAVGESIACDGVCLTVERWSGGTFEVVAGNETLAVTTLGAVRAGAVLHLERALRLGDRLGGHLVQGHVDGTGVVHAIVPGPTWTRVDIGVPRALARYIAPKGSVTVDGVSLTINSVADQGGRHLFSVGLVPHTLTVTKLGTLGPGSAVNLETDLLARYLERLHDPALAASAVDLDTLRRSGFLPE